MATIDEIKDKLDIMDVLNELPLATPLKKCADGYHGAVSSNSQSGRSLYVNDREQYFVNHAGKERGDVLSALAWVNNMDIKQDFPEILRIASEKTGLALDDIDTQSYEEKREIIEVLNDAADLFHDNLISSDREYIKSQWNISDDTIDALKIGKTGTYNQLYNTLKHKYSDSVLKQTGLFYENDDGLKDAFYNRIMFPYFDSGNVVYFIGRDISWYKDKKTKNGNLVSKYKKQLTHSERYPYVSNIICNSTFYGIDSTRGHDTIYITEGVTDCIVLLQAGIPCISPVTTKIKRNEIEKAVNLCRNKDLVRIVNDNETNESGLAGALDTAKALEKAGIKTEIVILPKPEDIDKIDVAEYLKEHSADNITKLPGKRYWDIELARVDKSGPIIDQMSTAKNTFPLFDHMPESARKVMCRETWKQFPSLQLGDFEDAYYEVYPKTKSEILNNKKDNKAELDPLDLYTDEVKEYAHQLLTHGDFFDFAIKVADKYHVGDSNIKKICAISGASTYILNSAGVHMKPSGDSGKGKTHVMDSFATLFPMHKVYRGSMSGMAAYYNDELKPGMIFLLDDTDLNKGEGLKETIKRSTSNFQNETVHLTVAKGSSKKVEIPKRPVWWVTSVDGLDDDQLGNRFVPVDVDTSKEQDLRVLEWQKKFHLMAINPEEDLDVHVCRCCFDILGKVTYKIVIPFADAIIWNNADNRRNYPMFEAYVQGVAFYNIMQRNKIGDAYMATVEDCERAIEIYEHIAEKNATNMTEREIKLVRQMSDDYRRGHWFDRNQLSELMGVKYNTIVNLMHGRDGKGGLLGKVSGLEFSRSNTSEENNSREKICYRMTRSYKEISDVVHIDYTAVHGCLDDKSTSLTPSSFIEQLVSNGFSTTRKTKTDELSHLHKGTLQYKKEEINTHAETLVPKEEVKNNDSIKLPENLSENINTVQDTGTPKEVSYSDWLTSERKGILNQKIVLWIERNGMLSRGNIEFAAGEISNWCKFADIEYVKQYLKDTLQLPAKNPDYICCNCGKTMSTPYSKSAGTPTQYRCEQCVNSLQPIKTWEGVST